MEIGNITTAGSIAAPDSSTDISGIRPQERELIKAVKALDSGELFGQENEMTFIIDRESRRALVRIINRQTREVVMQIPPEDVIRRVLERNSGF